MNRAARLDLLRALKVAYDGEAIFRPSAIERIIACPGSVQLSAKVPRLPQQPIPIWTLEGSAMHKLAERALKDQPLPDRWTDFTYTENEQTIVIDQQMADGVATYVDHIAEGWRPDITQYVELTLSLARLDPSDPLLAENRGTTDCVQLDYAQREIRIHDLKGGRGVMVSPLSPQLKNYGLLVLLNFMPPPDGWKKIKVRVSQPRADRESERDKSMEYDPQELLTDFVAQLLPAMEAALDPNAPLNPGVKQCQFCPAKAALICPAYQAAAFDVAADALAERRLYNVQSMLEPLPARIFQGTDDQPTPMVVSPHTVVLKPIPGLSASDLATLYERAPLFEQYISAARHYGVALMQAGVKIPGWKLGRRTGHRAWKVKPEELQRRYVPLGVSIYNEPKLKSPAQMEKALTPHKLTLPAELYERPLGEWLLVPSDSGKDSEMATPWFEPIESLEET